jgi:hypothetical protein
LIVVLLYVVVPACSVWSTIIRVVLCDGLRFGVYLYS